MFMIGAVSKDYQLTILFFTYSASLPLFGILTFIGISSCRRGCVWGAKFRFGVLVCLLLMFPET